MIPLWEIENKNLMIVNFEEPKHNWIKVRLKRDDFNLEFHASAIPDNPVAELISSLLKISSGVSSTIVWHTEPEKYILSFEKQNEEYQLQIVRYLDTKNQSLLFTSNGDFAKIIVPFYRAIKNLFSSAINEKDWPIQDIEKIEKLKIKITENKIIQSRR